MVELLISARSTWSGGNVFYQLDMGWLRLVGSLKLQVSFAKEPYKIDYILRERPTLLRSHPIPAPKWSRQGWPWNISAGFIQKQIAWCIGSGDQGEWGCFYHTRQRSESWCGLCVLRGEGQGGYICSISWFIHIQTVAILGNGGTAYPTWDRMLCQSSKLERLFCHASVKRDVRALSFELWKSIQKYHRMWDCLYIQTCLHLCVCMCVCIRAGVHDTCMHVRIHVFHTRCACV